VPMAEGSGAGNDVIAAMSPFYHFPPVGMGSFTNILMEDPNDPESKSIFYNHAAQESSSSRLARNMAEK